MPQLSRETSLSALAHWVADNARWLKRQLRRRDRTEQDVDDLIQEAILRVAVSCERHEVRDATGMLLRTVTRLSINDSRDRSRHPYEEDSIETLDSVAPFIDTAPLPDALIEAEQNWQMITRVLETVDERVQRVFILNRIHGLKYRDIARVLNISVSTVEKNITWVMSLLVDAARRQGDAR